MCRQYFISLLILVLIATITISSAEENSSAELHEPTIVRNEFPNFKCLGLGRRCRLFRGHRCCEGTVCRRILRARRRIRRCVRRIPKPSPSPSPSPTPSSSPAPFVCEVGDDTEMVAQCRCFYDDPTLMPTTFAQYLIDSGMCFPSVSTRNGNVEIFTRAPLCTASCLDGTSKTSIGFVSITTAEGADSSITQDCLASLVRPIFSTFPRTSCVDAATRFFPGGMGATVNIEVPDSLLLVADCGITPNEDGTPAILVSFGLLNDLSQLDFLACGSQ